MGLFHFVTNFFLSQTAAVKARICSTTVIPMQPFCGNKEDNVIIEKIFIKNDDMKICKNCLHFIKSDYETAPQLARCSKFGIKDIVDGDIQYYYADKCRNDERLCGSIARWYEIYKNETEKNNTKTDLSNKQMHNINGVIIE